MKKNKYRILKRLNSLKSKISNRQLIFLLSILIGLSAGLSAIVIKNSVHFIQYLLHSGISQEYENYLYFVLPAVGIFITVIFIRFVLRKQIGHGIPGVLYAISSNNGYIKRHNTFSSVISSAFTVGFGGSVGLEGPTVATSAALGSVIGRFFKLNYKEIVLMLGCACAGAMAAIFKAPIAAIVFALEVIMLDLTMASLVPLLLSTMTASITSYLVLGRNVLYPFDVLETFTFIDIPYFIALGVITGLISVYFTRTYMFTGRIFERIKKWYVRLIIGGFSLGVLVFFFPALFGEGYEVINSSLDGDYSYLFDQSIFARFKDSFWLAVVLFLMVIFLKVVATSITFGSGGVGGIFAPTLFMGANIGLLFSRLVNYFGIGDLSTPNFALVGMGGMIAGVLHAPLTGIFLIADITSGYELFLPLMITATISYATIKFFETNSVYTIQLAKRKQLVTHNKDQAILVRMKIDQIIETDFEIIAPDDTLGEFVKAIMRSKRNVFPVLNKNKELLGIVTLNDVREIIFKTKAYDEVHVRDLMYYPKAYVYYEDSMEDIAMKIQKTGHFNFPVLKDGKYIGFVSRANVFSTYRSMLKEFSDE